MVSPFLGERLLSISNAFFLKVISGFHRPTWRKLLNLVLWGNIFASRCLYNAVMFLFFHEKAIRSTNNLKYIKCSKRKSACKELKKLLSLEGKLTILNIKADLDDFWCTYLFHRLVCLFSFAFSFHFIIKSQSIWANY